MRKQLLFVFAILWVTHTILADSTCGGNCPDQTCSYCPCGQTPLYISVENFCTQSSKWNFNCCKCVVTRLSNGNAHFTTGANSNHTGYVGVMRLATIGSDDQKAKCDPIQNFNDAEELYGYFGWNYNHFANDAAKACGCIGKNQNLLEQQNRK